MSPEKAKVAVFEDDPDWLSGIKEYLEEGEHEVVLQAESREEALAMLSSGQNYCPAGSSQANAESSHIWTYMIHGVYDSHGRGDGSAGGIDIKINIFLWVL